MALFGCLAILGVFALAAMQLWAGLIGLDAALGFWWTCLLLIGAMLLRTSLPLVVGVFLGAYLVWGWPWIGALLFAAPGILLVVPGTIARVIDAIGDGRTGRRR